MDKALLTIRLAEEALATTDFCAVFGVVSRLLMGQDVAKRGICRELEAADFEVDAANWPELAGAIDIRLDVDGFEAVRKAACLPSRYWCQRRCPAGAIRLPGVAMGSAAQGSIR